MNQRLHRRRGTATYQFLRARARSERDNEYGLLKTLIPRPGRVFSRDELLARVWGDSTESIDRTVDAHVKTLRAKLKSVAPGLDPIHTHRGAGLRRPLRRHPLAVTPRNRVFLGLLGIFILAFAFLTYRIAKDLDPATGSPRKTA